MKDIVRKKYFQASPVSLSIKVRSYYWLVFDMDRPKEASGG